MYLNLRVKGNFLNRFRAIASGVLWAEDLNKQLAIFWPYEANYMRCSIRELLITQSIPSTAQVFDGYYPKGQITYQIKYPADMKENYEWIESDTSFHPDILQKTSRGISCLRQIRIMNEIIGASDILYRKYGCKTTWPAVHIYGKDISIEKFEETIPKVTNGKFWLSTDNPEIKDRLKRYFGGYCVTGVTLDNKTLSPKEKEVYQIIEWNLLQKFNTIISSENSSYSDLAAMHSGSDLIKIPRKTLLLKNSELK